MRTSDRGRGVLFLMGAALSLAATWPRATPAADDPSTDYLVQIAFADHCKQVLPPLSGQVDNALAAWKARVPPRRLASLQAYADSKAGRNAARGVAIAIDVAGNNDKLIASHECVRKIIGWGLPMYPPVAHSRIEEDQARFLVASIAPLALARLDCLVLDSVEAAATAPNADAAKPESAQAVPMERWTFSACGRTHAVSVWRREGKYNLSAKDRFDLSGM